MKYLYYTLSLAMCVSCVVCQGQSIKINELMASNSTSFTDETGSDEDWIELYNAGAAAVDLSGYYVTDDAGELKKFQLPSNAGSLTVQPGSFLILWASGLPSRGPRHLGFGLSGDGEQFLLVAPNESIIDQVTFTRQRTDVSYGRKTNGSAEFVYFLPSSPNANNVQTNSYTGFSAAPVMSAASCFFQTDFTLTISAPVAGAEVYYTTDGSEPDKNNITAPGKAYQHKNQYPRHPGDPTEPILTKYFLTLKQNSPVNIPISNKSLQQDVYASISTTNDYIPTYSLVPVKPVYKGTVIRAKVYEAGKLPSETVSRSYWLTPNGQPKSKLAVFSIKVDPDDMFDYEDGIGVAGKDFMDWRNTNSTTPSLGVPYGNYYRGTEIPANVEILINGSSVVNQQLGLRIHGQGSRTHDKKSFRLYSTGANASQSDIDYPLFPNQTFHTFKRLVLRNSGNDYERTLMKDSYIHQIAEGLNIELQDYRPVSTYLNGEYWGLYDLRERQDEYYYASHYSLEPENIEFFTDDGIENNSGHYADLSNFIKTHNMADAGNYNYALQRMDMDNFVDYCIMELYAANWDWPYGNITYWRHKVPYNPSAGKGKDGRWRWALFDVDLSFEELDANQFSKALGAPDFLLSYLLPNTTFRNKFINRYADLINTHFLPQRLLDQIQVCKNLIKDDIPENINRWNRPSSYATWESNINLMVNFATNRPNVARGHIQSQFALNDGTQVIDVDVSNKAHGYVRVNTIDIQPGTLGVSADPYPWSGTYFKNVNIALTAIPKPGYKFLQWENLTTHIVSNTATIEFAPSSGSKYRAVFAVDVAPLQIPAPLDDGACVYNFNAWLATAAENTFPDNMRFVYMENDDPGLTSNVVGFTSGVYNLTSRTRINGLGDQGISLINTGNAAGNPGYPGMKLGGAILALKTTGKTQVNVKWTGGTVMPNTRPYAIRLQYRLSESGPFTDVLNTSGQPVQYMRAATAGHQQVIDWVKLPSDALNKPYVQLLWRYYCTDASASGARDELRLDDIAIQSCSNPLPVTLIRFNAEPAEEKVVLDWTTTEETNNEYFDVERSQNAAGWLAIGRLRGKGTISAINQYRMNDLEPLPGTSYYRLKQVDTDGSYTYSQMVSVKRADFAASVFPSPADQVLHIALPDQQQPFSYTISDVSGKIKASNLSQPGKPAVPVGSLSSGVYVISIQTKNGASTSLKFIKK
ncbi:CotH kinase family protein [Dyadobacter sp. CY261]|uniref:CotH kinase family protein n=1 Tax=Dyadobacter sp. CY261 TaxID=2907203 RepID=UPI001F2C7DF0|nr:CotH kinase family protein [Dyadobacter sp. CY261]MCF0070491.1 CotH kinase family protein [Dyadobacter sp. CY261]